uniref:Serine/threonine-protein kinase ppk34 n=2 Tax=Lygus hesperus TaxID=30085 RepID=A0A0A9W5P2_LYGHE
MFSLADAVRYLHSRNIIHGDIKPQNVLLCNDFSVRLTDFGASQRIDGTNFNDVRIDTETPQFMAPEMCASSAAVNPYLLDIWALGVTVYACTFLVLPFNLVSAGDNILQIMRCITTETLCFPHTSTLHPLFLALLERLLCKDPHRRITVDELLEQSKTVFDLSAL